MFDSEEKEVWVRAYIASRSDYNHCDMGTWTRMAEEAVTAFQQRFPKVESGYRTNAKPAT